MAGTLGPSGFYADGQILHGGDLAADLITAFANDEQAILDLFANYSFLLTGCALTNGSSGMQVNVAQGNGYDSRGIRFSTTASTVTLANGSTSPRFDAIVAINTTQYGTNLATGNPTVFITSSLGIVQGTPAGLPVVPTITQTNYAQIGYVLVPNGVNSILSCTLYSQSTGPNSLGPVATIPSIMTHINSSILTTTVHGAQATIAGGITPNRLAYTGAQGGVGALQGYWFSPGSGNTPATDGFLFPANNGPTGNDGAYIEYQPPTTGSNTVSRLNISATGATSLSLIKLLTSSLEVSGNVQIDGSGGLAVPSGGITASGAVAFSNKLTVSGGPILNTSSYNYAVSGLVFGVGGSGFGPDIHSDGTNLYIETGGAGAIYFRPNGYGSPTGAASLLSTGVMTNNGYSVPITQYGPTQYRLQMGGVAPFVVNNQSSVSTAVTWPIAFSGTPNVVAVIDCAGTPGVQYGMQCVVISPTSTGCTIQVGQTTGGSQTLGFQWLAYGPV